MKLISPLRGPMEQVRCNLCGADKSETLATHSRFNLPLKTVICQGCGLIYHNPRMTLAGFTDFYTFNYRQLIGDPDPPDLLFSKQVNHGTRVLAFASEFLAKGSQILDVGCGTGGQLWVFRHEYDCEVVGIEPAVEHAAWARQHHNLNIIPGMIEQVDIKPESLDFIIVSQVLNHLLDPLASLCRLQSWLKPTGKIFIEVMDGVYFTRLAPLTTVTTIDHPYMFSPQTLQAMLTRAGFTIQKWEADADKYPNHKPEPGQPHLHIRAIAQKRSVPETINYPFYQDILQQIWANQRAFQKEQARRWLWTQVDQAKGFTRVRVGEHSWQLLRNLYCRLGLVRVKELQ